MDAGDVAAWVGAPISIGAAFISLIAVNYARKQAEIAQGALEQAERSAKAAEESAAETRRANDFAMEKDGRERAERFTERHEREQPVFSLTPVGWTHVRVTMLEGPPEGVHVRVESVAIVTQADQSLQVPISLANDPNTYTFVRNATREFAVDMRAEKSAAQARLVLLSEEIEGKRSWRWIEDVMFPAPPATSSVHIAQDGHQPPISLRTPEPPSRGQQGLFRDRKPFLE